MINLATAEQLLDFDSRIQNPQRSREQLEGAVALHNILEAEGVAYLADEVGMGKTYVALGAMALFRHFDPGFRLLVIAPRENIQSKWMKETRNFVEHNFRHPDLRVKAIDGRPASPLVSCSNVIDLVREVSLSPRRDFFVRMTSFSLPIAGKESVDPTAAYRLRDGLRKHLPWFKDEVFDLRNRHAFKDNIARALCCALPEFDLVIVDEAHNLKHGFGENVSSRNRALALAFGRDPEGTDAKLFPGYGLRAKRVLFLSATPVEETYTHLWNQLDIFGLGRAFKDLCRADVEEGAKKSLAARFLLRRVTTIRSGGEELTKNLYRREWREGGVAVHDEPIRVTDPRQRLVLALVQKKVSEILRHERFNNSWQVGMLASFESFLETAKLKRDVSDLSNFDGADQTDDQVAREGIDVHDLNRLARSHRSLFQVEMPHPKMDALVDALADSWDRGKKTLVFVRRVASVAELKRKLDERYDKWLIKRLEAELPEAVRSKIRDLYGRYQRERLEASDAALTSSPEAKPGEEDDSGGLDTFFSWFFRGEGPRGVVSGANVQQRFTQRSAVYATFFEDNHVAEILGCRPGEVTAHLCRALGVDSPGLHAGLQERSKRFLSRARKVARGDRFEAVQAAAIDWLKDVVGPFQESARVAWHELFEASIQAQPAREAPEIGDWLELRTFFTELRLRDGLRQRIWPRPTDRDPIRSFRERELRRQLLASAARLGHAFIDLYVMTIRRLGSLDHRAREGAEGEEGGGEADRISDYLDLLDQQMSLPASDRPWRCFDELSSIAESFDLLLDVNAPDARSQHLASTVRRFGTMLGRQRPVGGMSGQVNQTLVGQFRMPGYPFVLVTTDLLQEGEDLHTFCSSVHHYGISWTPSSMEQRIGRIDRVRSQTDRRLASLEAAPKPEELLQVYFPYLDATIEVLQVERVLSRMNVFLRLMHEGLVTTGGEERSINVDDEFARRRRIPAPIRERLTSAFPVLEKHLRGERRILSVGPDVARDLSCRFKALHGMQLSDCKISWEPSRDGVGTLMGTARLANRVQPFTLLLGSTGSRPLVRCISPIGRVDPSLQADAIVEQVRLEGHRIGALITSEARTYDLTVEGDVLLAEDPASDLRRVAWLIRDVVSRADSVEQALLPGKDEPLEVFREDLLKEAADGV